MSRLKIVGVLSLLILVGASLFAACSKGSVVTEGTTMSTTTAVTTTTTPAKETSSATETLKIGMTTMLSGPAASYGLLHQRGSEMAKEEINSKGGIKVGGKTYLIDFVIEDNKNSAEEGLAAANKLINVDKVKYLIAVGTIVVPPTQAVTEPQKIFVYGASYGSILGTQHPYTFRITQAYDMWAIPNYQHIRERFPQAKIVSIIDASNSAGLDYKAQSLAAMQVVGGFEVGNTVLYEAGTKDFAPYVTALLKGKPDIIDMGSLLPGDAALVIELLRSQGYNGPLLFPTTPDFFAMAKIVGEKPLDGIFSAAPEPSDPRLPQSLRAYYTKYMSRFGPPFNIEGAQYTYDGAYALKAAMEEANSIDTTKVKEAMEAPGFTYQSLWGNGAFGGKEVYGIAHQAYRPIVAAEYYDGKNKITTIYDVQQVMKWQTQLWPIYIKLRAQ